MFDPEAAHQTEDENYNQSIDGRHLSVVRDVGYVVSRGIKIRISNPGPSAARFIADHIVSAPQDSLFHEFHSIELNARRMSQDEFQIPRLETRIVPDSIPSFYPDTIVAPLANLAIRPV